MSIAKVKLLLITTVVVLSTTPAWAISEGGAIFLMIRPGARPSGMGSAFCAVADDATATYYNPAGIAFLKRNYPLVLPQDIRDWNRFLNSFKDTPETNVYSWADFSDGEGMVVLLSGSALMSQADIADWGKLITVLADTTGLAGRQILPLLSEDARVVIAGHASDEVLDSPNKAVIIFSLNNLINQPATYKKADWKGKDVPRLAAEVMAKYRMLPDSLGFTAANITDPQGLTLKIKSKADPVSQYIYGKIAGKAKVFMSRKYQEKYSDSLKVILAAVLNDVCRQPDFYSEKRFKNIVLSQRILESAGQKYTEGKLAQFNLDLLLQTYPGLLDIRTAELSREDLRLLNRKAMESILGDAVKPFGSDAPGDSLTAYIRASTRETIDQIFLQYAGDGPMPEAERRLWLDEMNNNILTDSMLARQPAPAGKKPSQYLGNMLKRGPIVNPAVLNRALLLEYYPEWFVASQLISNPYQYLKGLMSPNAISELNSHFRGQGVSSEGRQVLLSDINDILSRTDFYQKEQWANLPIPVEAQEYLAEGPENLSLNDLRKMNRMLLESLYPADLVKIGQDKSYVSLMHSPWLSEIWSDVGDMYYEYLAYVQPYKDWGVFGGSLIFISEGTSQHTGPNGEDYGEFSSYEFSPCLSYGNEIFKDLAGGVNLKLIHSHLAPFGAEGSQGKGVATTWALDFGLLYRGPLKGLSFGANLQNIGPKLEYIDAEQADPLSRNIRAGTAYKILDGRWAKLTAAYDITKMLVVYDRPWREELKEAVHHGGLEYQYTGAASLGLRAGYVSDEVGKIKGATYGFGVGYKNIQFDFGMEPGGELQKYNKKFSLSVEL